MFAAFAGPRATALVLTTPPGGAVSGTVLTGQPAGELRSANGRRAIGCAGAVIAVTVQSGTASLSGETTAIVSTAGTFAFTGLVVTGAGAATLRFVVVNFPSVAPVDAAVTVAASGVQTQLLGLASATATARPLGVAVGGGGGGGSSAFSALVAPLEITAATDFTGLSTFTLPAVFGDYTQGSDATAPQSPPDTGRTNYAGGIFSNGDGGATIAYEPSGLVARRIGIRMWVKFSANYSWHTHFAGEKFFYPVARNVGGTIFANSLNMSLLGTPTSQADTQSLPIRWWLTPQTSGSPNNYFQTGGPTLSRGVWHCVEIYLRMNDSGVGNGVFRSWIDGVEVTAWDTSGGGGFNPNGNLTFVDGDGWWENIRFTGTRGGGASAFPTPAGGQFRDYDRIEYFWSSTRA